ncbi:ATP-grasp domain-containing protein [Umezawaea beigongshangensis]|uniref:ATP-grasp domain-containing protein n=1 Tax=Umezawaea beigongshangensis TaxID=2780383 RepID=UPI0018F265C2|nr:ATP-grasp domain-containing protein [Umezawaea beigongshangensis]
MIFCCDPVNPTVVDEHFRAEAAAAPRRALIDHDALCGGDADLAVRRVPRDLGPVFYRGWMIPVVRYAELATALTERGSPLATSPEQYRRAHELPGWYEVFAGLTPRSAWTDSSRAPLPPTTGAMIVKDWVKSRKHEWDTACFVPGPEAVTGVVREFVRLQGEFLAGGVVLREFEEFTGPETRVWWVDGEPVLAGPHPDAPDEAAVPGLADVAPAVAALDCRFVTTDVVRRADGAWRVVEVGDGQVSDLPRGTDPTVLHTALARAVENAAR